jgi:hypothetical protein
MKYVRERGHLDYLEVEERVILKLILKQKDGARWSGLIWLRMWQVTGACEHGNDFLLP